MNIFWIKKCKNLNLKGKFKFRLWHMLQRQGGDKAALFKFRLKCKNFLNFVKLHRIFFISRFLSPPRAACGTRAFWLLNAAAKKFAKNAAKGSRAAQFFHMTNFYFKLEVLKTWFFLQNWKAHLFIESLDTVFRAPEQVNLFTIERLESNFK